MEKISKLYSALPGDKILDWTNFKAVADKKFKVTKILKFYF